MKLFISYRRSDSTHAAQRVRMCLQSKFGAEAVFIDREIPAGKDWAAHLEAMLEQCTGVIVLVGDAFLRELRKHREHPDDEPDRLAWEIETALRLKKTIYPVLIGAIDMPEAGRLPEAIRGFAAYQAVFAREPAFDAAMNVLIKSIADEHGWFEPAAPAAGTSASAADRAWRIAAVPALALGAWLGLWFTGRLILWLAEPAVSAQPGATSAPAPSAPSAPSAFWYGAHYALATMLWGLGPYLAFRAVSELRARARLPIHNLHGLLVVCNLGLVLVAGGTFLLLSTRSGWELGLLALMPQTPRPLHYALQGLVLMLIVFAAMAAPMLEPRVRQLQGAHRVWGMGVLNAIAAAVMLCVLWFASSLAGSLPPLSGIDPVPLVGWVMLTPGLSVLAAVWGYAQSRLGFDATTLHSRALFGLSIGLYLACTLAYYAHGPARLLAAGP